MNWTQSAAIRRGNAANHIQAICDGPYLALTVNGERLAETTDTTYSERDIALAAGTPETEPTEVHLDNLVVRRPPD